MQRGSIVPSIAKSFSLAGVQVNTHTLHTAWPFTLKNITSIFDGLGLLALLVAMQCKHGKMRHMMCFFMFLLPFSYTHGTKLLTPVSLFRWEPPWQNFWQTTCKHTSHPTAQPSRPKQSNGIAPSNSTKIMNWMIWQASTMAFLLLMECVHNVNFLAPLHKLSLIRSSSEAPTYFMQCPLPINWYLGTCGCLIQTLSFVCYFCLELADSQHINLREVCRNIITK